MDKLPISKVMEYCINAVFLFFIYYVVPVGAVGFLSGEFLLSPINYGIIYRGLIFLYWIAVSVMIFLKLTQPKE